MHSHKAERIAESKAKARLFLAFALIAGISVLKVIALAVDGAPPRYRWLNIAANYLGFGLSPAVSVCLAYVLDRQTAVTRWVQAAA